MSLSFLDKCGPTILNSSSITDRIPSSIDFTKNNMSDQITTNYEKICTIKEKNEFSR